MSTKKAIKSDLKGRKYLVLIPHHEDENDAEVLEKGIEVGPPTEIVDSLEIPEPFATRLHNQLFERELYSLDDIKGQGASLQGALKAAYRVDLTALVNAYNRLESDVIE